MAADRTRKTVTVLFCDLVDSSGLLDRLDPEALLALNAEYYAVARSAIERHGGTVEKYIGDAVMAIFGIPAIHEDDALRAVRAAVEIRAGLEQLQLVPRIGIETGEVVAGDHPQGHGFATGLPIVVADRLQKRAGANGILVGETTFRLVRDAVTAEPERDLRLKGVTPTVNAWRINAVERLASGLARRLDTPLVGRRLELDELHRELRKTVDESRCRLVFVIGAAGVGKSRLVVEFLAELREARALTARCPRYGEGTGIRPLVDIVREVGRGRFAELSSPRTVEVLEALLDGESPPTADDISFAVRELLEALAAERPLVVVFEDVESAEPSLRQLVEYLALSSSGKPILIVCVARSELFEAQAALGASAVVQLEPLSEADGIRVLTGLAGAELDHRSARTIVEIAHGNPLFAEELFRMLVDEGALHRERDRWVPTRLLDRISPPVSVKAVLSARLDGLDRDDRKVVQTAAVIGQQFSRSALAALASDPATLDGRLERMALKQLLAPAGDATFAFGHPLIREVAYATLPKAERAELHERFARFLVDEAQPEFDLDERVGDHLYAAARARLDLDPADDRAAALAAEAIPRLEASARRAVLRQDSLAAAGFLARTVELVPADDPRRPDLVVELGEALLGSGQLEEAEARFFEAEAGAGAAGRSLIAKRAALDLALVHWYTRPADGVDAFVRAAAQLIPIAEEAGDDEQLARAWILLGYAHWARCEIRSMQEALEHARPAALRAGREARALVRRQSALAATYGPVPADEALRICHELMAEAQAEGDRSTEARIANNIAYLDALAGRFEAARARCQNTVLEELGDRLALATQRLYAGRVELLAGDPAAAETSFRDGLTLLETLGDRGGNLAELLVSLGESLHRQSKDAEAAEIVERATELANPADVAVQIVALSTLAEIRAGGGSIAEAEALAREAVAIAERTDVPIIRADALRALSAVLLDAGSLAESQDAAQRALRLYESKGSVPGAAAARSLLPQDALTVP